MCVEGDGGSSENDPFKVEPQTLQNRLHSVRRPSGDSVATTVRRNDGLTKAVAPWRNDHRVTIHESLTEKVTMTSHFLGGSPMNSHI